MPQGCLWFVIVVFPDHTNLLFLLVSLPYMQILDFDLLNIINKQPTQFKTFLAYQQ